MGEGCWENHKFSGSVYPTSSIPTFLRKRGKEKGGGNLRPAYRSVPGAIQPLARSVGLMEKLTLIQRLAVSSSTRTRAPGGALKLGGVAVLVVR